MAENTQKEGIARYRTIALAPQLIEQKDMGGLEEALICFREGVGVQRNQDTEEEIRIMVKNPQTLNEYLENFTGKYQKELMTSTLKDLREEYSDLFGKFYTKANLPKVNKLFDSGITYGKIMEQYQSLKEKATSKTSNFSDEQKKQAKSELEELSKIVAPLQAFESLKVQSLGVPIDETNLGKALNAPYEKKEELPKAA